MSSQRDVSYHPHPIYDIPGFGLDALPRSFASYKEVVSAKGTDFTSASIAHGTNGFNVRCTFAAGATGCVLEILDADNSDALLVSYAMVPGVAKGFTFFDTRLQISAHPNVKFKLSEIANPGTVSVSICPTA